MPRFYGHLVNRGVKPLLQEVTIKFEYRIHEIVFPFTLNLSNLCHLCRNSIS